MKRWFNGGRLRAAVSLSLSVCLEHRRCHRAFLSAQQKKKTYWQTTVQLWEYFIVKCTAFWHDIWHFYGEGTAHTASFKRFLTAKVEQFPFCLKCSFKHCRKAFMFFLLQKYDKLFFFFAALFPRLASAKCRIACQRFSATVKTIQESKCAVSRQMN